MANDYSSLQNQMAGDMSAAATAAALGGGGGRKKIHIRQSELPSLVPNGARVWIEGTAISKLVMGDIICVTLGQGPQLRRFVRLKMTQSDTLLITAYEGFNKKEALPKSSLVGKVVEAEAGGKKWDPNKQNPIARFWGKLTEYGTHKPFGLGSK